MSSIRILSLAALASFALAVPTYVAFGQPDTKPATQPTDAPKPGDAPPRGQPGDGPRGPGGGQPGGRGGQRGDGAPANARQGMSVMNRALRTLKDQASDATKKEENLKLINDMERGCVSSKGAPVPDKVLARETDKAKKDEITTKYRKSLITMMEKLLALETAVMDGKGEAATKLIGEIETLRDQSHTALGLHE